MRQAAHLRLLQNATECSRFLELGPHFLFSLPRATLKMYNKFKIAIAPAVKHRHKVEYYHLQLSGPDRAGWVLRGVSQNWLKRIVLCWWLFLLSLGNRDTTVAAALGSRWARRVQDLWGWVWRFSPCLPPVPKQSSLKWFSALLCLFSAYT